MFKKTFLPFLTLFLGSLLFLQGCQLGLEIKGSWVDQYSSTTTFTETEITSDYGSSSIIEYDNWNNVLYYQTSATDQYNPNKYGKIVWTEPTTDDFYYCTVTYGKETLEDAKNDTTEADETDMDSGCGGFAWSHLNKATE